MSRESVEHHCEGSSDFRPGLTKTSFGNYLGQVGDVAGRAKEFEADERAMGRPLLIGVRNRTLPAMLYWLTGPQADCCVNKIMGQSFDALPPPRRAQRYREMADAALARAHNAETSEQRAGLVIMASAWHTMAVEMEQNRRSRTQLEQSQARLRAPETRKSH
jgi:hypothetical protein